MSKTIANHIVFHKSDFADTLCSKLTCFFTKEVLQHTTKVIIVMPQNKKPLVADRQKEIYDEVVITKFDPSNPRSWMTMEMRKYLYFINYSDGSEDQHVFIDQGSLVTSMPSLEGCPFDFCFAKQDDSGSVPVIHAQNMVHRLCGLSQLPEEDLVPYNCSIMYVSENGRAFLRDLLKHIINTYSEHIHQALSYGIMSYLAACAKKEGLSVGVLDISPVNIRESKLIEDFYTLV